MALQYCVSADNTERNLADLDYIPTEQLFCSKYKKMVKNKISASQPTANTDYYFSVG